MTVFFEIFGRKPSVYIFGAGHVGSALTYHLKPLSYHIVLIDNRDEYAEPSRNPGASEWIRYDYEAYAAKFDPPEDSYAVILTHGHKYDYDILKTLYQRELPLKYIGVISSKTKAEIMKEKLLEEVPGADISKLHSPIGLPLGGDSAHEIAVTIAAQLQKIRYNKD